MKKADRERDTFEQLFEGIYGYHRPYTPMRADLKGRVAILTGAAGMIGGSVALLYAACGARVAVWDIDDQGGAQRYVKSPKKAERPDTILLTYPTERP